ncbi:hypothetical protein TNCV_3921 [Trichonephila clavipes]|nr:hypothetical protein TNCV_3921 [Trichonephila clavipes]
METTNQHRTWGRKPHLVDENCNIVSIGKTKSQTMGWVKRKWEFGTPCRQAESPHLRLMDREERGSDPPQRVLLQNWDGTELSRTVTCMVLKASANDGLASSPLS